jgi:hypothetical protein
MRLRIPRRITPFFHTLLQHLTEQKPIELSRLSQRDLEDIKRFYPMEKFFVFGHSRSGTSLLARLIRTHPEVHCDWTGHFFTHRPTFVDILQETRFAQKLSDVNFRWNEGSDARTIALRALIDFFLEKNAMKVGKHIVGDKSPNTRANGQAVRYMQAIYPDGKLIYIVRDGRDAIVSQRMRLFIEFPERLSGEDRRIRERYLKDPDHYFDQQHSVFSRKEIRRRSAIWEQNVRETVLVGEQLLGDQFLTLRFEDLLRHPYQEISRVWEFLGADPSGLEREVEDEMNINPVPKWQKSLSEGQARSTSQGRKGTWQQLFSLDDRLVFENVAGKQLLKWGYETDLER